MNIKLKVPKELHEKDASGNTVVRCGPMLFVVSHTDHVELPSTVANLLIDRGCVSENKKKIDTYAELRNAAVDEKRQHEVELFLNAHGVNGWYLEKQVHYHSGQHRKLSATRPVLTEEGRAVKKGLALKGDAFIEFALKWPAAVIPFTKDGKSWKWNKTKEDKWTKEEIKTAREDLEKKLKTVYELHYITAKTMDELHYQFHKKGGGRFVVAPIEDRLAHAVALHKVNEKNKTKKLSQEHEPHPKVPWGPHHDRHQVDPDTVPESVKRKLV